MTTRNKHVITGEFVSDEFAEANPELSYAQTIAEVDPLTAKLAAITAATDTQVSWSGTILGITRTGVSPEEIATFLLLDVQALIDPQEETT